MNRIAASRIANPLILLGMVVSGLMTNCDDCGDTTVNGVSPVAPASATTMFVPGCVSTDTLSYRTAGSLTAPDACGGLINGSEITLYSNLIGVCPMGVPIPKSQSFQVYWTLCNTAAAKNDAAHGGQLKSYDLRIMTNQNGQQVELRTLPFTQPVLDPCACTTQTAVFNSPTDADVLKKLTPGTYEFLLSSPYDQGKVNRALVTE